MAAVIRESVLIAVALAGAAASWGCSGCKHGAGSTGAIEPPEGGRDDAGAATIDAAAPLVALDARRTVCSADSWCEVMKVRKGQLYAVWGINPHNVYALWSGLLVHQVDFEWASVPIGAKRLMAIAGSAADDLWAVGDGGEIWHGTTRWESMTSGTKMGLRGAAARARDDVWAVGEAGTLLHFGGTGWKSVFSDTKSDLLAVWADGKTGEAWAVGNSGTALRWAKGAWNRIPTPAKEPLGAIWGSGSSDVWAVGGAGTILHWDGKTWTIKTSPSKKDLYAVWGQDASDAWAVGAGGTILRWDGEKWSVSPSGTENDLHGVWSAESRDVWAVGFDPASGEASTLRRHR